MGPGRSFQIMQNVSCDWKLKEKEVLMILDQLYANSL